MKEFEGYRVLLAKAGGTGLGLSICRKLAKAMGGEMKDSYAEKGFDGILLKPANLEALKRLLS